MKVSTTSTSAATLAVPYTCRCAYCGTAIHGKEKITAEGHAFTGGYATGAQGERMKLAASMRANASMPYEIEYAEKRLDHYRDTVSSGRLKAYLESGKKHKEDYFRVDPNSPLGNYLLHGPNKTVAQADHDKIRMTQYPYNWKAFDKNTAVKCPACGKVQPWCEDLSGESAGWKAFFLGAGVCILGLAPFMAGLKLVQEQVLLVLLPLVSGIVAGILIYKALRKKQLQRQAALPWNADDLPRFDEDFLAAQKARYQQAGDMGMMP